MQLPPLFLFLLSLLPASTIAREWQKGDPCPTAIKTIVPGYVRSPDDSESPSTFGTMVSVHAALSSCPDIAALDLRVTGLGCSEWPDRWNFPFKLEGGERYPALKELRLEGYRFTQKPFDETGLKGYWTWLPWPDRIAEWVASGNAWKHLRYLRMDPVQRNKTNLDLWLEAMDWSQIESLGLLSSAPLDLAPRLTSLTELELFTREVETNLEFITGLKQDTLTHLIVKQRPLLSLARILQRHGQSLKSLELRSEERLDTPSPTYNTSELSLLSHMTPNLSNLSINIHRNGTWPLETFDQLAAIPSLRNLGIWLDITSDCQRQRPDMHSERAEVKQWELANEHCAGEGQFQHPLVNDTSALAVFRYLQERKTGEKLEDVTFWVGDWTRSWDGPLYFPDWLEGKRSKVLCGIDTEKVESGEEDPVRDAKCVVEAGGRYWARGNYWNEQWDHDDEYE